MMKPSTTPDVPAREATADVSNRGVQNMWTTIIIILIPTIAGVIGQLMLKVGMSQMGALGIRRQ